MSALTLAEPRSLTCARPPVVLLQPKISSMHLALADAVASVARPSIAVLRGVPLFLMLPSIAMYGVTARSQRFEKGGGVVPFEQPVVVLGEHGRAQHPRHRSPATRTNRNNRSNATHPISCRSDRME